MDRVVHLDCIYEFNAISPNDKCWGNALIQMLKTFNFASSMLHLDSHADLVCIFYKHLLLSERIGERNDYSRKSFYTFYKIYLKNKHVFDSFTYYPKLSNNNIKNMRGDEIIKDLSLNEIKTCYLSDRDICKRSPRGYQDAQFRTDVDSSVYLLRYLY